MTSSKAENPLLVTAADYEGREDLKIGSGTNVSLCRRTHVYTRVSTCWALVRDRHA